MLADVDVDTELLWDSPQTVPDGHFYAWLAGDLRRASVERRGGLAADVADTLRWGRGAQHSVWDLRDPGPTWHLATWRFGGAARSR